jgi:SOS response regulatory protein OraA/RecX
VAEAIARSETSIRKRGKLRVKRKIESAGIRPTIAKQAVDELFGALDTDALLQSALDKRLKRDVSIPDERAFNRLYRYLVGQGFEPDRVLELLRSRK